MNQLRRKNCLCDRPAGIWPRARNRLTASRKYFGCRAPLSPARSMTSSASSTISPANTFAMPDMAMTTFWETEHPVMVCIKRFTAAFGNAARRYISYRSNCSSVKFETKTLRKLTRICDTRTTRRQFILLTASFHVLPLLALSCSSVLCVWGDHVPSAHARSLVAVPEIWYLRQRTY